MFRPAVPIAVNSLTELNLSIAPPLCVSANSDGRSTPTTMTEQEPAVVVSGAKRQLVRYHCSRSLALLRIRRLDETDVQLWQAQLRTGEKNRLSFANPTCIPTHPMTFQDVRYA